MVNDEPNEIITPGAAEDDFIFEQIEGSQFVFWDKKTKAKIERPQEALSYLPLDECPWSLPSGIEPYESKEKLWHEIRTFLIDHVFLPDERLYDVLIAWVLANWISEQWDVLPYLLIKGPMSSGKTRLLETLQAISYRGISSAHMTSSALFRVLELHRPTIFLDETEIYNKEEYSDVFHLLNAGYRRGQKAWRVENDKDGQRYVKGYDVFGFKALAGTEELAATLNSRSIIIDMVKNIQRINFSVNKKRALALRNRLLMWRFTELSNRKSWGDGCDESDDSDGVYPLLEKLKDGRLMELFYCLLTLANEGKENIFSYAQDMLGDRENEEQASLQYQVLEAMLKCKEEVSCDDKLLIKTIKDKMNEQLGPKEQFTSRFLTRLLAGLGFKKCHMRKGVGISWNEKMLDYRLKQYRLGVYTPAESSQSSQSSPNNTNSTTENLKVCCFCNQSITGIYDVWKENEYDNAKPCHTECYEKKRKELGLL